MDVIGRLGRGAAAALACGLLAGCSTQALPDAGPRAGEAAAGSAAATPEGNVVVGQAPPATGGFPSIIVLEPRTPREFPPQAANPIMDQVSLTFIPGLLTVRTGLPAEFRNSDPELHNIRVKEAATNQGTFNVALPTGGTYLHTFERDGFYDVGCDIHPGMSAQILATSTPHTTIADALGHFELHDVAPGPYIVRVHSGARTAEQPLEVAVGRTEVNLANP